MKDKRINISPETKALIEHYAIYQGHRNLSAALATIVHHGVPFLMGGGVVQAQAFPLPQQSPVPSSFVEPTQEMSDTIEQDATIARLSLLLEEF